jgi:hypothetical protein
VRAVGQIISTSHDALEGVKTDAQGRFELKNVPKSLCTCASTARTRCRSSTAATSKATGASSNVAVRELPRDKIESLEIQVELRCHVQVELVDANAADHLAVLDAKGHELVLSLFVGEGRQERRRHEIQNGRSAVLGVPDTGRTLVLFKGDAEGRPRAVRAGREQVDDRALLSSRATRVTGTSGSAARRTCASSCLAMRRGTRLGSTLRRRREGHAARVRMRREVVVPSRWKAPSQFVRCPPDCWTPVRCVGSFTHRKLEPHGTEIVPPSP